jgi:hypothetical protein
MYKVLMERKCGQEYILDKLLFKLNFKKRHVERIQGINHSY